MSHLPEKVADWSGREIHVLSLSGGGFLGLYTAHILAQLEEKVKRPIASCFDLIAGTSIGGIIALGIAQEIPARQIAEVMENEGPKIFSERPAPQGGMETTRDIMRFAFKPKYSSDALRIATESILGTSTLADVKHPVVIPALNMTKGKPQVFKSPHDERYQYDWKLKCVDVALATSAAPTVFPIAEIGDELFVDGGLYANSPDLIAFHEATHYMCSDPVNMSMLSIGTTTARYSLSQQTGKKFGAWHWMADARLISATFGSQQQIVRFLMEHLLHDRYVRLDYAQAREQERYLRLDVATEAAIKDIRGLARSTIQENISNPVITKILTNAAPPAHFFYGKHE